MQTYIKTTDSTQYAAVRASRTQLLRVYPTAQIVPSTVRLRDMARIGAIPTYEILSDGRLARL